MNTDAKRGHKVIYDRPHNGFPIDQLRAEECLDLGKEYTVDHVNPGKYYSTVYLVEVAGIGFNSVLFTDKERV